MSSLWIYAEDKVDQDVLSPESSIWSVDEIARPSSRCLERIKSKAIAICLSIFEGGSRQRGHCEDDRGREESVEQHVAYI